MLRLRAGYIPCNEIVSHKVDVWFPLVNAAEGVVPISTSTVRYSNVTRTVGVSYLLLAREVQKLIASIWKLLQKRDIVETYKYTASRLV